MGFDITSQSNERIKWLVRLRERKHRDQELVFVVEGQRLYERALDAGLTPRITFVSQSGVATVGETLTVAPDVLDKASYRARSQALIAVFEQTGTGLDDIDRGADPLLLIAENVEKPGNLGAMCRTAAAAGATAVVTVGDTVDPWNPNAIRASTGAIFSVPVVVSSWDEVEPWLAVGGVRIVAASPGGGQSMWQTDLTGPVAVVIGAEDEGLSKRAASIADELVVIPQTETGVDSLNASVAAAVVLFEAARQRAVGEV
ncbi:MAG TPA: RNA methyltransferase [Acidimicrobiia bacterium]